MSTPTLPGWLQVTLVLLCGVVGWLLLRPYSRITQLTGASSGREIITTRPPVAPPPAKVDVTVDGKVPEARGELQVVDEPRAVSRTEGNVDHDYVETSTPRPRRERWVTPDVPEPEPSYTIYRPASVPHQPTPTSASPQQREVRTEARAETR